jgi:hypothetical protein
MTKTLRDEFAMSILPAIYAEAMQETREGSNLFADDQWRMGLAIDAYMMADAMLIAALAKYEQEVRA